MAGYAALVLAKILSKNGVEVKLTSEPKRDQYIVLIGNKLNGYYVYDPLTNPALLFEYDDYKKEIMPTFSLVDRPFRSYDLTITEELAQEFAERWITIKEELVKLLSEFRSDVNELLHDFNFINSLTKYGVPQNQMPDAVARSLRMLNDKLASLKENATQNKKYSLEQLGEQFGDKGLLKFCGRATFVATIGALTAAKLKETEKEIQQENAEKAGMDNI